MFNVPAGGRALVSHVKKCEMPLRGDKTLRKGLIVEGEAKARDMPKEEGKQRKV